MGVIGKPSDWLISSIPDYKKINDIFNIRLIDIDINEVIDIYNNLCKIDNIREGYNSIEMEKAMRFSKAMQIIKDKYNLKSMTIRCFDLLKAINTTGCIALSDLNDLGIVGTCEGDIMAMISMYIIKVHFGKESFQANPSSVDIINKEVIFAHCTIPLKMCESYTYDSHFESKIGVAIRGKLYKRRVGVFRISSDLKRYFFECGEIIENLNEDNLCRTQIKVKFENDISSMLTNPKGNHHIIFYLND